MTDYHVSGAGSLSIEVFEWICEHIPRGSKILELGSGEATRELAKAGYLMFSVEHDLSWIGKYKSRYIYAPLKKGWYDIAPLKYLKRITYELIIVDGPPADSPETHKRRLGFLENLDLFDSSKSIIVDDCQRPTESFLLEQLRQRLKRPCKLYRCENEKIFGVIQ